MADDLSARLRAGARGWRKDGKDWTADLLDEAADALDAAPPPGEVTVEWSVRYEYLDLDSNEEWLPAVKNVKDQASAEKIAGNLCRSLYYRKVKVVTCYHYVTEWLPPDSGADQDPTLRMMASEYAISDGARAIRADSGADPEPQP